MIRAYRLQTHEMLFDALAQAFRVLGGVPRRGIFDNMRTAIDRIGSGKTRQINARFAAMASHDLFEATFCNPASGWEKGQVEKNVQDARGQIWQAIPSFADLASLNVWLETRCIERWSEVMHGVLPGSVAAVHAEEQSSLMPVGRAFDGFVEHTKRVSPTCLVHFETNRYSVPASFANRLVSLRIYPDRLVVVAEGQVVCEHARVVEHSHDVPGRNASCWSPCRVDTYPATRTRSAAARLRHASKASATDMPSQGRLAELICIRPRSTGCRCVVIASVARATASARLAAGTVRPVLLSWIDSSWKLLSVRATAASISGATWGAQDAAN